MPKQDFFSRNCESFKRVLQVLLNSVLFLKYNERL